MAVFFKKNTLFDKDKNRILFSNVKKREFAAISSLGRGCAQE